MVNNSEVEGMKSYDFTTCEMYPVIWFDSSSHDKAMDLPMKMVEEYKQALQNFENHRKKLIAYMDKHYPEDY